MSIETTEPICIKEDELTHQKEEIAKLLIRADYKDQRIDELLEYNRKMEEKIDKIADAVNILQIKSLEDDSNINNRVTALESSRDTMWKVFGISISVIGVVEPVIIFILNNVM